MCMQRVSSDGSHLVHAFEGEARARAAAAVRPLPQEKAGAAHAAP